MRLELAKKEIEYLKNLFDYTSEVGTIKPIKFEEMTIFDKIKNAEETEHMTINDAIKQLQKIIKADCGVGKTIEDFLKALVSEHKLDMSKFCELDSDNFKAIQILITAMKTEDRFIVWDMLSDSRD